MKRALEELSWKGLTIVGAFIGLFIGLTVAPELPEWAPWALGIGVVAVFIAVLVLKRFRKLDDRPH
jgi:small basic protein